MSIQTGRKIGFFAALSMLIGSVVGIGIFFKSHGILRANDWNGTGTLIAWLLGGLLSLAAAISFSEMGSLKTRNVHGLNAYAEITGGKKYGYFTRFNYSSFYFPILIVVLGFFGSEMLVSMLVSWTGDKVSDVPIYGHVLIACFITTFFITMNFMSIKASGIFQTISGVLKWIPLILVAVLGIALATTNNAPNENFGQNAFSNGNSFKFTGMLAAMPAVLFAFDAFLIVTSLGDKVKGGQKKMPLIILVGMISIVVLYTLIALAAILHGSGMVSGSPFGAPPIVGLGIFDQVLGASAAKAMGKVVIVFLLISTLGVINGVSAGTVAVMEQAVVTKTFFGSSTLTKKFGQNKAIYIICAALLSFYALVVFIPTIILNSDSIVDGISNFPTLFMFAIYGITILLYVLKRDKLENEKQNSIMFKTFAWIAIIGIALVITYQLIYGFFIQSILYPGKTTHWGLYIGDSGTINGYAFPTISKAGYMTYAQASIVYFTFLGIFMGGPFLNRYLSKKFEKIEVIIDTQDIEKHKMLQNMRKLTYKMVNGKNKFDGFKMGKKWILFCLIIFFWPVALFYYFTNTWPNQLSLDEQVEYKEYLVNMKGGK
ncbi:APC family permease [Candidatus Mycoplasma mahonii]|uniref:APC family permease n=1 Tax=Candidatus Mycoplasma mahonii TaxID=3004105 RepID=UPI0026F119D4|nr:amino acid permease [Candidatus Mycoplasma mahonii]WKX02220.1 amino acid permease [Candidatus Mycoplasma mahonii]